MADQADKHQKTEEATPQRLREAREKGQVALSSEAISAMSLIAVAGSVLIMGGFLAQAVGALVYTSLRNIGTNGLLTLESTTAAERRAPFTARCHTCADVSASKLAMGSSKRQRSGAA